MDPNESGAVQMETKAQLEAPLTKAKEVEDHSVEAEAQMKHQALEKPQNTGGVHNGESRRCRRI